MGIYQKDQLCISKSVFVDIQDSEIERLEMENIIGTCSKCNGPVEDGEVPTCKKCGAKKKQNYGPVIEMEDNWSIPQNYHYWKYRNPFWC